MYMFVNVCMKKSKVNTIKWNCTDEKKVKNLGFHLFSFLEYRFNTLNFQTKHSNSVQVSMKNLNQTKHFAINIKSLNLSQNVYKMFSFQYI